jgi:hypothetical protein
MVIIKNNPQSLESQQLPGGLAIIGKKSLKSVHIYIILLRHGDSGAIIGAHNEKQDGRIP